MAPYKISLWQYPNKTSNMLVGPVTIVAQTEAEAWARYNWLWTHCSYAAQLNLDQWDSEVEEYFTLEWRNA